MKTHVMAMGGMIEAEGVVDQGMKFSVFFRQVGLPAGVEQV